MKLCLVAVPGTSTRGTVRGGEGRDGSESGPDPSRDTDTSLNKRTIKGGEGGEGSVLEPDPSRDTDTSLNKRTIRGGEGRGLIAGTRPLQGHRHQPEQRNDQGWGGQGGLRAGTRPLQGYRHKPKQRDSHNRIRVGVGTLQEYKPTSTQA